MDGVRRPRRGAAGWAAVVGRWRASGLSVEAFCQRDGVNRSGFYCWRSLLEPSTSACTAPTPSSGGMTASAPADFVDLGVLGQVTAPGGRLELRLDLGAGLVLTLVRG